MSDSLRVTGRARPHVSSFGTGCVALALASSLAVEDASAQEKARPPAAMVRSDNNLDLARSVAVTGREAFNAGDYETALALFRRAYTLYPAPTVVLYEARALDKMGLLMEALEAYERTAQMPVDPGSPAQFAEALAAAAEEGRQLRASIPSLTIKTAGVRGDDPNLKVSLNERPLGVEKVGLPQKLNPGRYRVSASVGTERADRADVVLNRGQRATVVLHLAETLPPPPPAPTSEGGVESAPASTEPSVPLLAYAAGGLGVLGIGSGVITGLLATGKHGEAVEKCPDGKCALGGDGFAAASSFRTLRTVSTVSYGIGAAGVGVGLLLWLTADAEESPETGSLEPWGSANTAGIRGRF
jgi:hypothetical protein